MDRLSMISGGQRLSFHGGVSRGALALAVEARSFDLASIPSLALPARLAALGLPG